MSFIREPRLYFCVGHTPIRGDNPQTPRWLLQFQPVIAFPSESPAPMQVQTTQESLARFVQLGKSYTIHDTDEGNGVTRRHIEPGEKKIVSLPAFKDRQAAN